MSMRAIQCQVQDFQRADPDFIKKYKRLERELDDPKKVVDICIHESGHLIYWRRAGVPDIKLFGPTVFFDAPTKTFAHFAASVAPNLQSPQTAMTIDVMVKAAVAGAVFSKVVAKNEYRSEIGDMRTLKRIFPPFHWRMQNQTFEDAWKDAETAVEQDLNNMNEAFRREIELTVSEIGSECFDMSLAWSFGSAPK
jgi:hypothetical protein